MADGKTAERRLVRDAWRLIDPRDILYHVGNLLTRRSLRYTMLTAGLSVMVHRLTLCDYRLAGELRALFDPEYIDGSLDEDFLTDLRAVGLSGAFCQRMHRLVDAMREDLNVFDEHLLKHRGDLLSAGGEQALRAARIGFHTDAAGLKRKVLRAAARKRPSDKAPARIDALIHRATENAQTHTRWLVALRMHHTLAKIAIEEYTELIEALYTPCRGGE
jgi:hypothetical protein